jgi:hypothetical protein
MCLQGDDLGTFSVTTCYHIKRSAYNHFNWKICYKIGRNLCKHLLSNLPSLIIQCFSYSPLSAGVSHLYGVDGLYWFRSLTSNQLYLSAFSNPDRNFGLYHVKIQEAIQLTNSASRVLLSCPFVLEYCLNTQSSTCTAHFCTATTLQNHFLTSIHHPLPAKPLPNPSPYLHT